MNPSNEYIIEVFGIISAYGIIALVKKENIWNDSRNGIMKNMFIICQIDSKTCVQEEP